MFYLQTKKMSLNSTEEFTTDFEIISVRGEHRYLVGISELVYAYPDTDHQVQGFSLNISSYLSNSKTICVTVKADMYDRNDKNHAQACKDSYVNVSVFAFSSDIVIIRKNEVTTLGKFDVAYSNTDHKLQAFGAAVEPPLSYLQDQHDSNRVNGSAGGYTFSLPDYINVSELKSDDIKSHAVFLKGFGIKKKESDCNVLKTGVIVSVKYMDITKQYIFKDKQGDQALSEIGTHADAFALYITKDGRLAFFSFDRPERDDNARKLNNVRESFDHIVATGVIKRWPGVLDSGSKLSDKWKVSHIQGFSSYTEQNLQVFSHSLEGDCGYLIFSKYPSDFTQISTYDKGFNHPGGIQAIGDYLLVPCEKINDENKSYIRLYDMSPLKSGQTPKPCEQFCIYRDDRKATAAGITKYADLYGNWFLIVICNWGTCDFYKAKANKDLPDCNFIHVASIDMSSTWDPDKRGYDVQCLNLVTQNKTAPSDNAEQIFMTAFATKLIGTELTGTYEDHAVLISIIPEIEEVIKPYEKDVYNGIKCSFICDKHLETRHNATPGTLGVHFRYGAALEVKDDKLVLYATGRNFTGGDVLCNFFDDAKRLNDGEEDELV